ncbi:cytochrome P450, partial [Helicosporidium sp. ATCC 50920]
LGFEYDFQAIRHYGCDSHDAAGEMVQAMEIMHADISKSHSNPLRHLKFWNPELAEIRRAMRFFHEQVRQVLRHMRARGPPTEADFSIGAHLQRVIDPRTGKPLTDEYMLPEITAFLVAGSDTTSHTMSFASWLIAAHPHVEARICEELASLGLLATAAKPIPRAVEWEDLGKLKYLNAVVKETMRLLPVSAEVGAMDCDRDVVLAGHRIPAKTTIWAPIFLFQRSALLWERPNEFDPSRWMQPGTEYAQELKGGGACAEVAAACSAQRQEDEGGEERHRPLRYAPFSQGPRSCVGQPMAELSYKSALATIYGRFTFDIDESMPSDPSKIADSGIIALTLHVKECLLRPRLRVREK